MEARECWFCQVQRKVGTPRLATHEEVYREGEEPEHEEPPMIKLKCDRCGLESEPFSRDGDGFTKEAFNAGLEEWNNWNYEGFLSFRKSLEGQ